MVPSTAEKSRTPRNAIVAQMWSHRAGVLDHGSVHLHQVGNVRHDAVMTGDTWTLAEFEAV